MTIFVILSTRRIPDPGPIRCAHGDSAALKTRDGITLKSDVDRPDASGKFLGVR